MVQRRTILPTLDLRTEAQRQGISSKQETVSAIAGILKTVGQSQQVRQERQQLDNLISSLSDGPPTVSQITEALNAEQTFAPGIKGGLQRIAGEFAPQTGGLKTGVQSTILSSVLKRALEPEPLLTRDEQREIALSGKRPRAGEAKPAAPTKQEKQRDRDLSIIASDKKNDFQKNEARKRIDADPSQPRQPVPPGQNDENYAEFLNSNDKEKGKFGEKAYKAALKMAEDEARLVGGDPKTVKRDFDRWWDGRVERERTGLKGKFVRDVTVPRDEFGGVKPQAQEFVQGPITQVGEQAMTLIQKAVDDKVVSEEEFETIKQALEEDPANLPGIIGTIARKRRAAR